MTFDPADPDSLKEALRKKRAERLRDFRPIPQASFQTKADTTNGPHKRAPQEPNLDR